MIKAIELIVVATLMVFSFVVGVKYSDSVKSHAGWLFETKEEEVDLPDLTNEAAPDAATVYDNGDQMPQEPMDNNVTPPMDATSEADVPAPAEAAPVTVPAKSKTHAAPAKAPAKQ